MSSPLFRLPNTYRAFYGAFIGLHPIQLQAIDPVLANRDLIVQSATGSGKTEAVLAPCIETIISLKGRRAALYIVPTRALAFDIRRRFADMLKERLHIRLAIRTGDIKSSGGHPDIMLTTPESLDVMLGSSNSDLQAFLLRVRTVIIDEVHPFIHQYRGQQLAYLLQRLEYRIGTRLQKIALSATIADPEEVGRFLHFSQDFVLLSENVRRQINPRLIHLKDDEDELVNLLSDLARTWKYNKILIFANNRGRCDKIFGLLNGQGVFKGMTLLHYSNLNSRERQVVELRFRRQNRAVCVATSTLELGIDIGDVDAVLLFEPPDSVSAFLQRIGRANRRQKTIHFWGICRGGNAGEQLLRFLALLRLAEEGQVEAALSDQVPSVLSQQFISCLYEKKRITLTALQQLFPNHPKKQLEEVFNSLVQKKWLKKTAVNGLYAGGYRYWQALVDHKIWSNFPENEDLYQLLVEDESVADIPKSIIKQIEIGDRLLLAGRRLQIVRIDNGEFKRILAKPVRRLDDKELLWFGKGSHVSYEVAQAMRQVLKSAEEDESSNAAGLFSRSRRLFRQQLAMAKRAVLLDNGIEVVRLANGFYQYRTFIGAVGNLILALSIREFFAALEKDIQVIPDEIGLVCSTEISFENLDLPLTDADFVPWLNRYFKMMAVMFAMNAFCSTLPRDLLRLELAGFVRDPRLLDFFALCRSETSLIVSGDPKNLHLPATVVCENMAEEIPSQSEPLLEEEKRKCRNASNSFSLPQTVFHPRAITGTLIGGYFRHQQCDRWLGQQFFIPQKRSSWGKTRNDTGLSSLRFARGMAFEEKVIADLESGNTIFTTVPQRDTEGRKRSISARFAETLNYFRQAGKQWQSGSYIVQPVLSVKAILQIPSQLVLAGVGIPDLIQLRIKESEKSYTLQIGDIKSSAQPRYYQKWQVAFYAWLLHQLLAKDGWPAGFKVATSGFILIPGTGEDLAERHVFDLKPYLAAMTAVLQNFKTVLGSLPYHSFWQLQRHCTSCQGFELCYRQAINEENIQFIPRISRGVLLKMRTAGIKDLHQETDVGSAFGSGQKKALLGAMTALNRNIITVNSRKTDLFPANITTLFIIHLVVEPVSGIIQSLGFAKYKKGEKLENLSWTATTSAEQMQIWQNFSSRLVRHWYEAIEDNRGPHLLLFGQETRQKILNLATIMADNQLKTLFSPGNNCHYTDLQQLLTEHFSLPLPGIMTLSGLNRILELMPGSELPVPENLLHSDRLSEIDVATVYEFLSKLWQWITSYLKSQYQKTGWGLQVQTGFGLAQSCREFITAERLQQQRDIAALMELTLAGRRERFRAMGPLQFTSTTLDNEGKNLYLFSKTKNENDHDSKKLRNIPAKFRSGDFLKLVPLGVTDLQSGLPVIMADFNTRTGEVAVYPRRRRGTEIFRDITYSLEEDGEDYHSARLLDAVQSAFSADNHQMTELFGGTFTYKNEHADDVGWLQNWLHSEAAPAYLNPSQKQALRLPFQYSLSLISGPPGTGKTHLLAWIIIALFRRAQSRGTPLRIAVSAVTHKAIDQILNTFVSLVNEHELENFPVRCLKWGRWEGEQFDPGSGRMQVEPCSNGREISDKPYLIVGATGFGFQAMMRDGKEAPCTQKYFDWVIFDEASQLLIPQALLTLVYGKGNFLFLGDIRQLPPIIRSSIIKCERDEDGISSAAMIRNSVLQILLRRYPHQSHQLNITYRMNRDICHFPSLTWYDGLLCPAAANSSNILPQTGSSDNSLLDKIIDPRKPVVLVEVDHQGCSQEAEIEAELLASLAHRLLRKNGLEKEQIAVLSPHRAQNNSIAEHLAHLLGHDDLPVIDTVERMQGAERDVILFGFTSSDPDLIFSEFLNNPNRFNVVLTRARKKIIIVGSKLFWRSIAPTEKQLRDNSCFKDFFSYCRDNNRIFDYSSEI